MHGLSFSMCPSMTHWFLLLYAVQLFNWLLSLLWSFLYVKRPVNQCINPSLRFGLVGLVISICDLHDTAVSPTVQALCIKETECCVLFSPAFVMPAYFVHQLWFKVFWPPSKWVVGWTIIILPHSKKHLTAHFVFVMSQHCVLYILMF